MGRKSTESFGFQTSSFYQPSKTKACLEQNLSYHFPATTIIEPDFQKPHLGQRVFAIRLGMPPSCDRCVMAQKLSELPRITAFGLEPVFIHQNKSKIRIHSTSVFGQYLFCLTLYYVETELCKSSTYKGTHTTSQILVGKIFSNESERTFNFADVGTIGCEGHHPLIANCSIVATLEILQVCVRRRREIF